MKRKFVISVFLTGVSILFCFSESIASGFNDSNLPVSADVSINGIYLSDPKSVISFSGKDVVVDEDNTGFPVARFCNKSKDQLLELVLHYGSVKNSFNEFIVKHANIENCKRATTLANVVQFSSGKQVRLGMKESELISIFGKGMKKRKNDESVISYSISNFKSSSFLRHYNMPIYYGDYKFREGRLIEFAFGFKYP